MISKRRKNATLRKNQKKRSNRRFKKFKMIAGSGADVDDTDDVCDRKMYLNNYVLALYYGIKGDFNTFLNKNMKTKRQNHLTIYKIELDAVVENKYHLYTPELFNTYVMTKLSNNEDFKIYCNVSSIVIGSDIIKPNLNEYMSAGFTIPDLLRCGVMFDSIDDLKTIKTYMNDENNKDILLAIISMLKNEPFEFNMKTFKSMGFTVSILLQFQGFTLHTCRDGEFSAIEYRDAGISPTALKSAGFTASELKQDDAFDWYKLKLGGFSVKELIDAKFPRKEIFEYELQQINELHTELKKISGAFKDNTNSQLSQVQHKQMTMFFSQTETKRKDYITKIEEIVKGLKDAGFTFTELFGAKIPVLYLQKAGFTLEYLITSPSHIYLLNELKQIGFDLIGDDKYNLSHIFESGKYTYDDIKKMYDLYTKEYKEDEVKKNKIKNQLTSFELMLKKYCKNEGLFALGFRPDCRFDPKLKSS
jgi:hypothetical protein